MYIKELYIGAFGTIHDRTFRFTDGVNLIEGHNEAGKSTLCAFIKFIFFGLAAKEKNNPLPDRKRYMPFGEGSVSGTLTLCEGEKEYRIARTLTMTGKTAARDEYNVTDLATGESVFDGIAPCEVFLNMSEGLFTRTAYIPQLTGTAVNGTEVTAAIENLLFSAEEEIDSAKALRVLDSARAVLLHKNGKGGKLFDAQTERDLILTELSSASGAKAELSEVEAQLDTLRKSEQENTRLLAEAQENLDRYECAKLLTDFEHLEQAGARIRALYVKRDGLCPGGSAPTSEDIHALIRLAESIRRGEEASAAAERLSLPEEPQDALELDGGEDAVRTRLRSLRHAATGRKLAGGLLFALAAIGFFTGAAHYFDLITLPTELHLPLIIGTAACGLLGALLVLLGITAGKKLRKELSRYGIRNLSELASRAHQAKNNRLLYEKAISDREAKRAHLASEQNAREADARVLCERYGKSYAGCDSLEDLAVHLTAVRENCTALETQIATEEVSLRAAEQKLSAYDKAELSARLGEDPHAVMAALDLKELKSRQAFGTASKDNLRAKVTDLEKAQIEIRARAKKEDALRARFASLNTEIEEMETRLAALRLAHERMEQASETVKEQVSPALAKRAGELLSRATGGKYDRLLIAHDLSLTYTDRSRGDTVRDAEYLSRGTKDLAYIALRIALCELLAGGRKLPMIFDESFAAMDDTRLAQIFAIVSDRDAQSLILTSQHRDRSLLPNVNYIEM